MVYSLQNLNTQTLFHYKVFHTKFIWIITICSHFFSSLQGTISPPWGRFTKYLRAPFTALVRAAPFAINKEHFMKSPSEDGWLWRHLSELLWHMSVEFSISLSYKMFTNGGAPYVFVYVHGNHKCRIHTRILHSHFNYCV